MIQNLIDKKKLHIFFQEELDNDFEFYQSLKQIFVEYLEEFCDLDIKSQEVIDSGLPAMIHKLSSSVQSFACVDLYDKLQLLSVALHSADQEVINRNFQFSTKSARESLIELEHLSKAYFAEEKRSA